MRVSKHAKKRIKQRFGPKSDFEAIATQAFKEGIGLSQAKGQVFKYLQHLSLKNWGGKRKIVAWKGLAWLAQRDTVITVLPLRHNIVSLIKRQTARD